MYYNNNSTDTEQSQFKGKVHDYVKVFFLRRRRHEAARYYYTSMCGKLHFQAPIGELVTFIGQLLIFLRYVVNLLIGKVLKPLRPCRRYKITYDASYTHLGTHVGKEGRERNSEEGKGRFSGQKRGLVKDIVQCIIRIQFGADRGDRLMHRRL